MHPVEGLTKTHDDQVPGHFNTYGATERAQPIVFCARGVVFPDPLDGAYVLMEMGGSGVGSSVYVTDAGQTLVARGGDGSPLPHASCAAAVADISGLGLAGTTQDVTWEFDPAADTARPWVGESLVAEGLASSGFADWAGSNNAGYGTIQGSAPDGTPGTNWPGYDAVTPANTLTLGPLETYANQLSTWTDAGGAVTGSGDALAPAAVASGSGEKAAQGSGSTSVPPPVAGGSGLRAVGGAGAAVASPPTADGAGEHEAADHSGAAVAPAPLASGAGLRLVHGSGEVTGERPTAEGVGLRLVEGTGAAAAPAPAASGSTETTIREGAGSGEAPTATASGAGLRLVLGSGGAAAPLPTAAGGEREAEPARWSVVGAPRGTITVTGAPRGTIIVEVSEMPATIAIDDYHHGESFTLRIAAKTPEGDPKTGGSVELRFSRSNGGAALVTFGAVHEGGGDWLFDLEPDDMAPLPEGSVAYVDIWDDDDLIQAKGSFTVHSSIRAAA